MILINLLPHREEARKRAKESFFSHLGLACLVGAVLAVIGFGILGIMINGQEFRNTKLMQANATLDSKIKVVNEAKTTIASLQARREAVENLQADRNLIVRWMEDLIRLTPDGVYLTKAVQKRLELKIDAIALSNDYISQFMTNTSSGNLQTITNSQWVGSIVTNPISFNPKEPAQSAFTFSLQFDLVRDIGRVSGGGDMAAVEKQ